MEELERYTLEEMEPVTVKDICGPLEITPEVFDVATNCLCDFVPGESTVTEYMLLILYQMKLAAQSRKEVV